MNKEPVFNQAQKQNPKGDASQLSPEVLDKIKHPLKMDHVIREQTATEKRGNQALVPEMLDEPSDIMTGYSNEQSG
ncbi:hypothetical protein [Sphaerospermopsis sp. LEGE 08334]|jgi:hypothetical protein|uniref:hypothetical protein n=1 Tax=Sphaerospermopsis sp. LEGE 08334 TaxID=1828651 RepID=UPI00187F12F4|nr:hypothetical protein [Sphaerospermopsis sp. LEGE 08334]MBE9057998.1 hypothetical protein [Sphaerospermopsis sp. LEGE 08334]